MKNSENFEKRHIFVCSGCGCSIKEGDRVWHFLGEQFCLDCVQKAEEVATCDTDE